MSIRALHYITGDTPQSGFRRIGASDAFPADQLPLLNHGEAIMERSRIESSAGKGRENGIQSHIWEYQTGRYGAPVVINSVAAIGTGRSHAFSEYVYGQTENAAELADAGDLIRGAEELKMLDVTSFMQIRGRDEVPCEEEVWAPVPAVEQDHDPFQPDETWRLTLLSRYWEQASVRAFSQDTPETVHVNLGEFSEDITEETETTIRRAKEFFADVICRGLPRQVQNIASMAAGVDCQDMVRLYTAIEFDITPNMFSDETMMLRRPRELKKYRLNGAEEDFITQVCAGSIPEGVEEFFKRYTELSGNVEATPLTTPFMADYRVWFAVYCASRIIREGHAFIDRAGLTNEQGNPNKIRDARVCFLLMRRMRNLLENDHRMHDSKAVGSRKNLVPEWLAPIETALMQVMEKDMDSAEAERFMLFRNEQTEFYRKYLYSASEDQREMMIHLIVRDQEVSKAPQFVRCYPSVPLRDAEADALSARLMNEMLPAVIRPLIDEDKKKGTIENKYLDYLRSEDFAEKWACNTQNEKTREVFMNFFREEIQDSRKHFLLYKITYSYLPGTELLQKTLEHFTKEHAASGSKPDELQLKIAQHGASRFIAEHPDKNCVTAMNRYYQACFREYRDRIRDIGDIVKMLGGDTTEAMTMIFGEAAEAEKRMTPEEAKAVFETFGGEKGRYSGRDEVRKAYSDMLDVRRDSLLANLGTDADSAREDIVNWTAGMAEAAPFDVDTSGTMTALFENGRKEQRIGKGLAGLIFQKLMPYAEASRQDSIARSYNNMMTEQLDRAIREGDNTIVDWISGMIAASNGQIRIDTTDSLKKIIESAKNGERMKPSDARTAFKVMGSQAADKDTVVLPVFTEMLASRRKEAEQTDDPEAFAWLCEMLQNCPWNNRREWLSEQRTENTVLACESSLRSGKPVDGSTLPVIQHWMEEGSVQTRGLNRMQQYCNMRMEQEDPEPAKTFLPYFEQIDEHNKALQNFLFDSAAEKVRKGLEQSDMSFGDLISSVRGDVERSGRRMDDLYQAVQEPVDQYLQKHFDTTAELGQLISEQELLPENTEFYRKWQQYMSDRISNQQVELFNRQANLDKMLNLRKDILQRTQVNEALRAAYELIDGYEERLERLAGMTEYDVVTNIGTELSEVNNLLSRAQAVRKKLCDSLQNAKFPGMDALRKKSFRHDLCAEIMYANLNGEGKDGPNWGTVIKRLFNRAEMDKAVKNPYKKENLPILQKLLALADSVRLMEAYGMNSVWKNDLINTIHSDSVMRSYQNALGRNRKMKELYGLEITGDGIQFE